MVEDASSTALSIDDGLSQQSGERRIAHQGVGAEGYQVVACRSACADLLLQELEHQWHRHGASAIGNDDEHALARDIKFGSCLRNDLGDIIACQQALRDTFAQYHVRLNTMFVGLLWRRFATAGSKSTSTSSPSTS